MAFTVASTYLDDLARRRAQAQAMAQTIGGATASGVGVLQGIEKRDAATAAAGLEQKNNERDAGLRLRVQTAAEKQREIENARNSANDTRDAAGDAADRGLRLQTFNAAQDAAATTTARNEAADARTVEADARARVPDLVGADAFPLEPEARADYARQHGVTVEDLDAETRRQSEARTKGATTSDLAEREMARKEADSRAQRARDYAAAQAAGQPKAATPRAMSDAGVKNVANLDTQIGTLQKLVDTADTVNLGPLDSRINEGAQMLGLDDPTMTRYRADTSALIDAIISDLSGASVPAAEWDRLKTGLPNKNDNDQSHRIKLEATMARIKNIRANLGEGYATSGRPMPGSGVQVNAVPVADLDNLTEDELAAMLAAGGG